VALDYDARLFEALQIIAPFSEDCGQAVDPAFSLWIVFESSGEAMPTARSAMPLD
jgi:hypothetical protein